MYTITHSLIFIPLLIQSPWAEIYPDANQMALQSSEDTMHKVGSAAVNTPRIAIIGAGIMGASSAHHLHQLARLCQPLDITVFEAENQVGGRVRSAHVHNEPACDVEVGAAVFTEDDWCLKAAMQEVGLKPAVRSRSEYRTGVWDGSRLLMSYGETDEPLSGAYWQSPKWLWRYGSSLFKIHGMIKKSASRFSSFAIFYPFLELSKKLKKSFPSQDFSSSAARFFQSCRFFESCRLSAKVVNEIIRTQSRYRHARELEQVNVLSSLLALRSAPNIAIHKGNQRLPHRMLKIAEAQISLNTRVSRVTNGEERRWKIHTVSTNDQMNMPPSTSEAEFDIFILTAPFASNGIDIDPPISTLASITEVRPYVERHVTLFSTLQRLSPEYFNQSTETIVPENILTAPTQSVSDNDNDIFSITVVDRVPQPLAFDEEDELEYVYKIISSRSISDNEIAHMLGHSLDPCTSNNISEDQTLSDLGVTWIHRQAWPHAYPEFDPKQPILDNIKIAPDMYYPAAAEEALSTMEMSCRMGKNVAKYLYISKWLGETYP